jgi:hypothetical protein
MIKDYQFPINRDMGSSEYQTPKTPRRPSTILRRTNPGRMISIMLLRWQLLLRSKPRREILSSTLEDYRVLALAAPGPLSHDFVGVIHT